MDTPTQQPEDRLAALEQKVDAIYRSVEKVRAYMFWTAVVTIAMIVLPLIGLLFAIPALLSSYSSYSSILSM